MPYKIDWYQPQNILLCQATGTITDADLWEMGQSLTTHLDESSTATHVIFNFEGMDRFPNRLPQIRHRLRDFYLHPALASVTVEGRVNPLAKFIFETLTKTFRVEYRTVDSSTNTAEHELRTIVY